MIDKNSYIIYTPSFNNTNSTCNETFFLNFIFASYFYSLNGIYNYTRINEDISYNKFANACKYDIDSSIIKQTIDHNILQQPAILELELY